MDDTTMECPRCKGECEFRINAGREFSVCMFCRYEVMLKKVTYKKLKIPKFVSTQRIILGAIFIMVIISFFALPRLELYGNNPAADNESIPSLVQDDGVIIGVDRARDIINNHADEIIYINFDGRYGGYSPFRSDDLDFEILLEWLQENQDSLLDERVDNSSINIIGVADGRVEFYVDNTLLEEFWDFLYDRTIDFDLPYIENIIPVAEIDWHYFESNYGEYIHGITISDDYGFVEVIDIENGQGFFDSSTGGYDLSVLFGFLAENQDSLNEELHFGNMLQISVFFRFSEMGIKNERYADGEVHFYIDESLHDQFWIMMENEFDK